MELCADERVPFAAGDNLASHHIYPVEAHWLYAPALGPIPDNQAHSPLRAAIHCRGLQQEHHVVSQPIAEISLVFAHGIYKNY